jgi:hypothetical protein
MTAGPSSIINLQGVSVLTSLGDPGWPVETPPLVAGSNSPGWTGRYGLLT